MASKGLHAATNSGALETRIQELEKMVASQEYIIQETHKDRANVAAYVQENHQLKEALAERDHTIGVLKQQNEDLQESVYQLRASNIHIQANAQHDVNMAKQEEEKTRALLKRSREEAELEKYSEMRLVKRPKPPRVAKCTTCYMKKLDCDSGLRCAYCKASRSGKKCKRIACQWFAKGQCRNSNCTFAHEGEECEVLVPHRKLKQDRKTEGERSGEHKEEKNGKDGSEDDEEEEGGVPIPV